MYANPIGIFVLAILALIAALAALVVALVVFANAEKGADKAANAINELSAEIYELDQKAQSINNVTEEFDALDRKILKTSDDLAAMNELLDKGGESLDNSQADDKDSKKEAKEKWGDEEATEKSVYDSLENDKQRLEFLKQSAAEAEALADQKRHEQLQ